MNPDCARQRSSTRSATTTWVERSTPRAIAAEAFDATLLTLGGRLARAKDPTCTIEVVRADE